MSEDKKQYKGTSIFKFILRVVAVMTSWYFNKSVWWAIFHYLVGPIYLVYKILTGAFRNGVWLEIWKYYF